MNIEEWLVGFFLLFLGILLIALGIFDGFIKRKKCTQIVTATCINYQEYRVKMSSSYNIIFSYRIGVIMLDVNMVGNVIVILFAAVWIFLASVKIKYVIEIVWNIKKGNFKIKNDKLVSINNNLDFKDSNEMISFKFENYKKIVYAKRKFYNEVSVGDDFYLIFVKGDKEPIRAYQRKQSVLEF